MILKFIVQRRTLAGSRLVSNFEAYQTNRMKIRFKDERKDAAGPFAQRQSPGLPRIVARLLKTNQGPKVSVFQRCRIPISAMR